MMKRLVLLFALFASACGHNTQVAAPTALATTTQLAATQTPLPTALPTLAPNEQYTIDYLRKRRYGVGAIEVPQALAENDSLTRYLIRYPSDGLKIYGFINIPKSAGPHPVIIAIHGYANLDAYAAQNYDTDVYDLLTQQGYVVIFPNLRTYLPSDSGDNYFRVGMTIDVLNLIALLKSASGPAALFAKIDAHRIGLWGYSMGGEIVLRALTISPDIKAAVLYASLTGDQKKNAEVLWQLTSDPLYQTEMAAPANVLKQISPNHYYRYITAPVQLFHGTADPIVPFTWAQETCSALTEAGVNIHCMYFPDEGHSFRSRVSDQFHGALLAFYQKYLSP